ncbi:hypothetical protein [Candidatus Bodocaedibacter vickermanii]|uniref:Putative secreted protein n=1 Tax=Candidatus Bodocaedibacter vickermanii TaxID=2741701 RepID=A0A7L9RTE4_9PROT|nr:putative secreted protein [Candidatus Paracaedibacteraceae bacterium 'Lake Konstanz']
MNKDLLSLSMRYIDFMGNVGAFSNLEDYESYSSNIFSQDVKKIENGKCILEGRTALIEQLRNARAFAFPWSIKVLDVLCDKEKNCSALRFSWDSEKVGLHITTAILQFDSNGKILEIKEVYNRFADITH